MKSTQRTGNPRSHEILRPRRPAADDDRRRTRLFTRVQEALPATVRHRVGEKDVNELNYGVNSIPMSFLLDRKGVLRYISPGADEEEIESLGRMVKKLVEE